MHIPYASCNASITSASVASEMESLAGHAKEGMGGIVVKAFGVCSESPAFVAKILLDSS